MWLSASPSFELRIVMDEDLESNTKAKAPPTQAPRSRLLLSCGESMLAVAESAYRRVEALSCPVGCLARGVSLVAAPILSPLRLRRRCLSALSFVDRQLAVAQDVAASLPVRFDGIEALVAGVTEGLAPAKRLRGRAHEGGDAFSDMFKAVENIFEGVSVAPEAASLEVVTVHGEGRDAATGITSTDKITGETRCSEEPAGAWQHGSRR
ncbi:hypothetical protein ACP70R_011361 [Stipagrostis hirtigluma subsp. patula]